MFAISAFVFADRQTHRMYLADARLLLGPELSSAQEAQTVVSRANSIATTTNVLSAAIKQAKVSRTPDDVRPNVSMSGIGDSGLAKLIVADRDPTVATALCRALAASTAAFINQTNDASSQSTLTSIQAALDKELAKYQQLRADASSEAGAAELAAISADISALSTARGQLLARQAQQVPASVVDQPAAAIAAASNRLTLGGLVAVGGLLFWLLAAFVAESIRPTFPTLHAVARSFDTAVLGRIRADILEADLQTSAALSRLVLAAERLQTDTIVLGGALADDSEFPRRLEDALRSRAGAGDFGLTVKSRTVSRELVAAARNPRARSGPTRGLTEAVTASKNGFVDGGRAPSPRTVLRLDDAGHAPPAGTGIVVVARPGMAQSSLNGVDDLARCTFWPVLGVVEVLPTSRSDGESYE
jgi:hypothetical protein